MSNNRTRRIKLMQENPHCHWCGIEVIYYELGNLPRGKSAPSNFATIDHLYDRFNWTKRREAYKSKENYIVLACYQCNQKRNEERMREMGKSFMRIRSKLGEERKRLKLKTPRPELFRDLEKLNEWDKKDVSV